MPETFSVAKDGLQIPYRRFLADSAPGFVLILLVAASFYFPVFTSKPLRMHLIGYPPIGQEMRVFTFVVLFLLATPLGFVVNALSWLFLSQVQSGIETLCCQPCTRKTFFIIWEIFEARHISELLREHRMTEKTFAVMTWFLSSSFENPHLAKLVPEAQTRGLVIFLRCSALFLTAGGFIALYLAQPRGWATYVCVASMLLIAFTLTKRWSRQSLLIDIGSLALGLGGTAVLAIAGTNGRRFPLWSVADQLTWKAIIFIIGGTAVVFFAGIVGYYNRCAIILHAHFASAAIGLIPSALNEGPRDNPLDIATALVARAAALERKPD